MADEHRFVITVEASGDVTPAAQQPNTDADEPEPEEDET